MTVDAGVLAAVADGCPQARAHLEAFRRHSVEVVIPAPAIAESVTGRRLHDARLNLAIRGCRVVDTTEPIARRAAVLQERADLPDAALHAMVVATSELVGGGALLTDGCPTCGALASLTSVRVETR
ncbi:MAG TPA: PIN domain-containing protein [Acidimicrobiales bacterium]